MGLKDLFAAHAGAEGQAVAETKTTAETHTVHVDGMHCNACEKRMCMALEERGATNAQANHETGLVTYEGDLDAATVAEAVASVGFELA